MPQPDPGSASPADTKSPTPLTRRVADFLFGYDFFIAYKRNESQNYAVALNELLEKRGGFSCCLDVTEFRPGDKWRWVRLRAIDNTSCLILVATRGALASAEVRYEVETFTLSSRKVIPIDCDGCLAQPDQSESQSVMHLLRNLQFLAEEPRQLAVGPSDQVFRAIHDAFTFERQDRKRVRWLSYALSVFGLLTIAVALLAFLAELQRRRATAATAESRHNLTTAQFRLAESALQQGRLVNGLFAFWRAYDVARTNAADPRRQAALNLIGSWSRKLGQTLVQDKAVLAAEFSPDGKTLVTGAGKRSTIWDVRTGLPRGIAVPHDDNVTVVSFSRDGRTILTAGGHTAHLSDTYTARILGKHLAHQGEVVAAAFDDDGRQVLTAANSAHGGQAQLWNGRTGGPQGNLLECPYTITGVEFRADDPIIFTGSKYDHEKEGEVQFLGARTGQQQSPSLKYHGYIRIYAISSNGEIVLTRTGDRSAQLWRRRTGLPTGPPLKHQSRVLAGAFNPEGTIVVTGSEDRTARLWQVPTGNSFGKPLNHEGSVNAVAFSPDGRYVLTASNDFKARLWDATTCELVAAPMQHEHQVGGASFNSDGTHFVTRSWDSTARLWDLDAQGHRTVKLQQYQGHDVAAFSPDCKSVVTVAGDNTARFWDARSGLPRGKPLPNDYSVHQVVFSPDGELLLTVAGSTSEKKGQVVVWGSRTLSRLCALPRDVYVYHAIFSPDSRLVLTTLDRGGNRAEAQVWDAMTGQRIGRPLRMKGHIYQAIFSPDGQSVLTGSGVLFSAAGEARLWNARTGKPSGEPLPHRGPVDAVAFRPDGRMVLTGSRDMTAQLWDPRTSQPIGKPFRHDGVITTVAFVPHGETIVTVSVNLTRSIGEARLWDARTRQLRGTPLRHTSDYEDAGILHVAFSPDGQTILTVSKDKAARLWDTRTGAPRCESHRYDGRVTACAFNTDGQTIFVGTETGKIDRWIVAPPAADQAERLKLSVEVRTGLTDDGNGSWRKLNPDEWRRRQQRLWEELDGPCDNGAMSGSCISF
jgi:WD40 repeat protein